MQSRLCAKQTIDNGQPKRIKLFYFSRDKNKNTMVVMNWNKHVLGEAEFNAPIKPVRVWGFSSSKAM